MDFQKLVQDLGAIQDRREPLRTSLEAVLADQPDPHAAIYAQQYFGYLPTDNLTDQDRRTINDRYKGHCFDIWRKMAQAYVDATAILVKDVVLLQHECFNLTDGQEDQDTENITPEISMAVESLKASAEAHNHYAQGAMSYISRLRDANIPCEDLVEQLKKNHRDAQSFDFSALATNERKMMEQQHGYDIATADVRRASLLIDTIALELGFLGFIFDNGCPDATKKTALRILWKEQDACISFACDILEAATHAYAPPRGEGQNRRPN